MFCQKRTAFILVLEYFTDNITICIFKCCFFARQSSPSIIKNLNNITTSPIYFYIKPNIQPNPPSFKHLSKYS